MIILMTIIIVVSFSYPLLHLVNNIYKYNLGFGLFLVSVILILDGWLIMKREVVPNSRLYLSLLIIFFSFMLIVFNYFVYYKSSPYNIVHLYS